MATLPRPAEPARSPSLELLESSPFPAKPKRLLDVSDVAEWLGVSNGWVRDYALGRRQPRLFAIKWARQRERVCGNFVKKTSISSFWINAGNRDHQRTGGFYGALELVGEKPFVSGMISPVVYNSLELCTPEGYASRHIKTEFSCEIVETAAR
jgi:hypothetical protein